MKADVVKHFYTSIGDNREEGSYSSKEKIRFLVEETGSNKRVLDVGCHDGFIGSLLLKNNNTVYGIDIVKKNLRIAKRKGLRVSACDIENEELPFPKDYFDVVLLGDIMEHVYDTDLLLRKTRRVLKKGGKLLVTTPNVASLARRIMLLLGLNPFLEYSLKLPMYGFHPVGHIRYYTIETLKRQLLYNWFHNIHITGDSLNLVFFEINIARFLLPTLCKFLLCSAIKK